MPLHCNEQSLPPRVRCNNMRIEDIDSLLPDPPPRVKKADCLIFCDEKVSWIIEGKGKALKDMKEQFDSTVDLLISGRLGTDIGINRQSLKCLVIIEKGMGGEILFERDDQKRLRRKGETDWVKVKNIYPIYVLDRKEIDAERRNSRGLMGG